MEKPANKTIPAELLAAFLDGNATAYESDCILQSLAEDAQLRELMRIGVELSVYGGPSDDSLGCKLSEKQQLCAGMRKICDVPYGDPVR